MTSKNFWRPNCKFGDVIASLEDTYRRGISMGIKIEKLEKSEHELVSLTLMQDKLFVKIFAF